MSHQANDAYMAEFEMAMEEMGISDSNSIIGGERGGGVGGVAGRARGAIGGAMGGSPAGGRLAADASRGGRMAGGGGGRGPPSEGRYPPSVTQQWAHGPHNPQGDDGRVTRLITLICWLAPRMDSHT